MQTLKIGPGENVKFPHFQGTNSCDFTSTSITQFGRGYSLFLLQGGCAFTHPHFLFLQGPTNKNKNGLAQGD
jgi:hypothetical protein